MRASQLPDARGPQNLSGKHSHKENVPKKNRKWNPRRFFFPLWCGPMEWRRLVLPGCPHEWCFWQRNRLHDMPSKALSRLVWAVGQDGANPGHSFPPERSWDWGIRSLSPKSPICLITCIAGLLSFFFLPGLYLEWNCLGKREKAFLAQSQV